MHMCSQIYILFNFEKQNNLRYWCWIRLYCSQKDKCDSHRETCEVSWVELASTSLVALSQSGFTSQISYIKLFAGCLPPHLQIFSLAQRNFMSKEKLTQRNLANIDRTWQNWRSRWLAIVTC